MCVRYCSEQEGGDVPHYTSTSFGLEAGFVRGKPALEGLKDIMPGRLFLFATKPSNCGTWNCT